MSEEVSIFKRESSEDISIKELINFLQRLDKNGHTHVDVWTNEWQVYAEGNQPIEIYPYPYPINKDKEEKS